MAGSSVLAGGPNEETSTRSPQVKKTRRRRLLVASTILGGLILLMGAAAAWLGFRAVEIREELSAATSLISPLKDAVAADDSDRATLTAEKMRTHTAAAKAVAEDPLWTIASGIPGIGPNFAAVAEISRSADDVARLGLVPLVGAFKTLDWKGLLPGQEGADLEPLKSASPTVSSAAYAVQASADRLAQIQPDRLLPEVAGPLSSARVQLEEVTGALNAAADASQLLPAMLGSETPQKYLLMIQNNAEVRASGGIPGALALLTVDQGKLILGQQSSALDLGTMSPLIPVDPQQQQIYSTRLGKFMQDVNLTPDFPSAAGTAQAMWERKSGQRVDGVISIDPVALGYVLQVTGPVRLSNPEVLTLARGKLPSELNGDNVVSTLLSDVYAKIPQPELQDVYFAGVAQEVFAALSEGRANPEGLLQGVDRAVEEGRLLVWSAAQSKQAVIAKYSVSGSISGPSVPPAQFGAYFNDGTGAKMDYYVKRSVQLVKHCPRNGYEEITVRIESTNTAPVDAASTLPGYVTGDGVFGVPPGSVQTNIVVYGPAQANVETATLDGRPTDFAPYMHANRPVGVVAVRLAPGERRTVEFTFGKIVQHGEPNIFVTPTVQPVKDVILATERLSCG